MTQPARPGRRWAAPGEYSLFLRIIVVACVIAILVAAFWILGAGVTQDRVAVIGIATGVALAVLTFL